MSQQVRDQQLRTCLHPALSQLRAFEPDSVMEFGLYHLVFVVHRIRAFYVDDYKQLTAWPQFQFPPRH